MSTERKLTRRRALELMGASAISATLNSSDTDQESDFRNRATSFAGIRFLLDSIPVVGKRNRWSGSSKLLPNFYSPADLGDLLPIDASNQVFDALNLNLHHPKTISRKGFHVISQGPAALGNLFFEPEDKPQVEQERDFVEHSIKFFGGLQRYSQLFQTDFIGSLLMLQISSEATPTRLGLKKDVSEEMARVGLGLLQEVTSIDFSDPIIDFLRIDYERIGLPAFPLPRLKGPATLGIHDLEQSMIADSLLSLRSRLPAVADSVDQYLAVVAPEYRKNYPVIAAKTAEFDAMSAEITTKLKSTEALKSYLQKFNNPEAMRRFLTSDGKVDVYQFKRTTAFWAAINVLKERVTNRVPSKRVLENRSLDDAINYYSSFDSPVPFFLDQICNPKMWRYLASDAKQGNVAAKDLLDMSKAFYQLGEDLLVTDRTVADAISSDSLEQNMEFQMLTGVSYGAHLLERAHLFTHPGESTMPDIYKDPNELGYMAFMASYIRENSALFPLAGTRPLHAATVGFNPYLSEFQLMQDFVDQVYKPFYDSSPQEDMRPFIVALRNLLNDFSFRKRYVETPSIDFDRDSQFAKFAAKARDFGVYEKILDPSHSAAKRATAVVERYIGSLTQ